MPGQGAPILKADVLKDHGTLKKKPLTRTGEGNNTNGHGPAEGMLSEKLKAVLEVNRGRTLVRVAVWGQCAQPCPTGAYLELFLCSWKLPRGLLVHLSSFFFVSSYDPVIFKSLIGGTKDIPSIVWQSMVSDARTVFIT